MDASAAGIFAGLFWMLILGGLPMTIGILLIVFARRGGPGHAACGQCGYDVKTSIESGSRCPECGSEFAEVGITPPHEAHRRNPFMVIPGVILAVLGVGFFVMGLVGLFLHAR
ncbi:MAG: hypothetical protein ACYTJ0_01165 [Planctomycetota bacterium]|jgi:hypothetical protein